MTPTRTRVHPQVHPRWWALLGAGAVAASLTALAGPAGAAPRPTVDLLRGHVRSGTSGIGGAEVTLWAVPAASTAQPPTRLGTAVTRRDGGFAVPLPIPLPSNAGYYVTARRQAAELAAVVPSTADAVVVNERTTVATGYALAQFIHAGRVSGAEPGPRNAAAMVANLVDPATGDLSPVLTSAPNGEQTSSLREFNTLANLLVPCTRDPRRCGALLTLATPPGGPRPATTFDAVADIARNPAHHAAALFRLAARARQVYAPTLPPAKAPDAWTLALRFDGDGSSLSGPGNFAIDADGDVWVTANYTYSRNPLAPVCGSKQLFQFTPDGRSAPGSPFTGGGVNGAGFGITLDPRGHVWLGNFGFASTACPAQPPHDSVSEFTADGQPLSPSATTTASGGYTAGPISWPQGVISNASGDILIANCGNDTLTTYPAGDPSKATTVPTGVQEPFDLALNGTGNLFVTGNRSSTVAVLGSDGRPVRPPITGGGLDRPIGIAADTDGNMWVANSGAITVPCPQGAVTAPTRPGSITYLDRNGQGAPVRYTGGGLTVPWGIAVDGGNHVWVANFGGQRLSEFCGTTVSACPQGTTTGQPISPSTGYGFNGLTRNTGVAIDPSGNVWVANNWKNLPLPDRNPGGYDVVAFLGAATPIRTPLVGPPSPVG